MSQKSTSALWQRAVDVYKAKLSNDDLRTVLSLTDHQDLLQRLRSSENVTYKSVSRLDNIQSGIEKYGFFLSIFASAIPESSTLLWGSLELVRQMTSSSRASTQLNELVASLMEDLCSSAPRLRIYEKLFEDMEEVDTALAVLYHAILDFFAEANVYIKRCASRPKFAPLPEPIKLRAKLEEISDLRTNVEREAWAANADLHYKWHEEIRQTLARVAVKPQGSLPCRIVPYPMNPRFVGRQAILSQMNIDLAISKPGQRSIAIHGMGGVGKTQIALKYIYDHMNDYPAVLWMNADSRTKLQSSFVDAAKRLHLEEEDSQRDADSVARALKVWMEDSKDEWLVVFDNADDLDVLKPFWPSGNKGTIIITSRNHSSAALTKQGTLVKPLPAEDGESLFMSIITRPEDGILEDQESEWIRMVVEKLGYLPLAINQVAHYMLERDCSVDDFYDIYNASLKSEETFSTLKATTGDMFYEHSLATVWKISLRKLSQQAASLLAILSCLDPDGVPEILLRKGSRGHAELQYLSDTVPFVDAVGELLRNGLVSKNTTQVQTAGRTLNRRGTRSLAVHRLVQETVFHNQDETAQSEVFSNAVDLCLTVYPHPTRSNFRLMHKWSECEELMPHLLALNARSLDSPRLILDCRLAELFLYGSWYLYERRLPELSLPLLDTAKKICNDPKSGIDWFLQSRIFSCFGCVLFECSKYADSEIYFRQALQIRLENVEMNDVLLAHGYQDIALPVTAQGRYDEAIELQKKALVVVELNDDDFTRRDMSFHIHHNMARTYEAAGKSEEGLPLHFAQGDEFGNGLREEMSESGAVNLYAIGNCYLAQNDPRGIEYHTRALKIRKQLVGEKGFYYGISLHKMGRILQEGGNLAEAADAFQQACDIFANSLDAQRELARSTYYLSMVCRDLGNVSEADERMTKAEKLYSKIMGTNKADLAQGDFDNLVIYIHN